MILQVLGGALIAGSLLTRIFSDQARLTLPLVTMSLVGWTLVAVGLFMRRRSRRT